MLTDWVHFSSATQSFPTLCNPINCYYYSVMSGSLRPHRPSMPGLPVHQQLPESTQTHVRWVSDAIQPSHALLFPSSLALNLSQHQGLFRWITSWHQVAKVLEFKLQHQSLQWIFRVDLSLGLAGLISLQSKGLSRIFSNTAIQKHQFFGAQPSLWSNSHIHTWPLEKPLKYSWL